ncbi:unnamed protein product [Sphagnum jensenii]|uniref:Two-component response regulator-like PRR37 n=1 Tax=Sphagnum jensenii TaxID=128206 RepID=A0ABP0X216_9BRYO
MGALVLLRNAKELQRSAEEEPHQVQPGTTVCWESFLPQHHVKVLLVEDDDATRHVVSALLRNCNYEVIAAANAVMAWELLESPSNQFDLVLLDVVMPSLSGVAFLLKIMKHDSFKQIPVVMTSKHDSMDIVYQCLSKGATDFLVKPVRKNELKNLWQHVWRKRNISANTEVGRTVNQTRKLVAQNSPVNSDNNMSGSNNVNDSENAGGSGMNINGGSDNGSGNQRNPCPCPVALDGEEDCQTISEDKSSSDQTLGCDLKMATPRPTPVGIDEAQQETDGHQKMDLDDPAFAIQGEGACMVEKGNQQEGEPSTSEADVSADRRSQKAVDLIGAIGCHSPPTTVEQPGESADPNEIMDQRGSNSPKAKENLGSDFHSPPTLELTLKWPRSAVDKDADGDEQRGLRQSGSSAFSRYSTMGLQQQEHPSGGTPPPKGHQMEGGTQVLLHGVLAVNSLHPQQMEMAPDGTGPSKGSGEVQTPLKTNVQKLHTGSGQDTSSSVMAQPVVQTGSKATNKEAGANHQQQQYYHSHHRHNTHHHEHQNHTPSFQPPPLPPQQEEQPIVGTPHCGCSAPTVLDGNSGQSGSSSVYGNGSSNESPSTTKNGSNGHNDNGVAVGTNGDSAGNSGSGSGSGVDNSTNVTNRFAGFDGIMPACTPEDRFAWREVALNKFRQKRKERCFAKKVRYQSRKKLAEQRPRVRGQFVRQTVQDLIDEAS